MPKKRAIEVRTTLEAHQVGNIFHDALLETSKRVNFENPEPNFGAAPDFAEFASGREWFRLGRKLWGLQVEVYNKGEFRQIFLVIYQASHLEQLAKSFGTASTLDRMQEIGNISYDKNLGRKKADLVLERLRGADPVLQVS